jgi:hypothetical protein
VLVVHLEMVKEMPAVLGDAEQMDPGCRRHGGLPGGIAVHRHGP